MPRSLCPPRTERMLHAQGTGWPFPSQDLRLLYSSRAGSWRSRCPALLLQCPLTSEGAAGQIRRAARQGLGCADFPCSLPVAQYMSDAWSKECRAGRAPPAAGSSDTPVLLPAQPRAGIATTPKPARGALTPTPLSLRLNPAAGGGDAPRRRRDNYWPEPTSRASWSSGSAISAWERPGRSSL